MSTATALHPASCGVGTAEAKIAMATVIWRVKNSIGLSGRKNGPSGRHLWLFGRRIGLSGGENWLSGGQNGVSGGPGVWRPVAACGGRLGPLKKDCSLEA